MPFVKLKKFQTRVQEEIMENNVDKKINTHVRKHKASQPTIPTHKARHTTAQNTRIASNLAETRRPTTPHAWARVWRCKGSVTIPPQDEVDMWTSQVSDDERIYGRAVGGNWDPPERRQGSRVMDMSASWLVFWREQSGTCFWLGFSDT